MPDQEHVGEPVPSRAAPAGSAPGRSTGLQEGVTVSGQAYGGARSQAAAILELQRSIGNAHVARLISDGRLGGRPRGGRARSAPVLRPHPRRLARFDPKYHRRALVLGLKDVTGFSSADIGAIYAGNWERDFSQAHPALGALVLAWKDVQRAKEDGRDLTVPILAFRAALRRARSLKTVSNVLSGEAYGGYRYYEHMDNPVDVTLDVRKAKTKEEQYRRSDVRQRLLEKVPPGIPRYIADSRDEMILQLVAAVQAQTGVSLRAVSRAQTIRDKWLVARADRIGDVPPSRSPLVSETAPDNARPAAEEAESQARALRGEPSRRGATTLSRPVTESLGRASHLIEDFFAHSNFVEVGLGIPGYGTELETGTFESVDKGHALSNKLRAFVATMRLDSDLYQRALGIKPITGESPWYTRPVEWARGEDFEQTLYNLTDLANTLETTTHWLEAPGSHTQLAKDQPGHGQDYEQQVKTIRWAAAQDCAVLADRLVLGQLPAIFAMRDPDAMSAAMDRVVDVIFQLIAPVSNTHPCYSALGKHRSAYLELYGEREAKQAAERARAEEARQKMIERNMMKR